jgi:hypothetical protein
MKKSLPLVSIFGSSLFKTISLYPARDLDSYRTRKSLLFNYRALYSLSNIL